MLDISINLVIVAHVVVSLLLVLVILMQRPKQEGLGAAFGSGMTDAAWGARTTDVLQKGTVYLGTLFFLLSLTLGILTGKKNSTKDFSSDGASKTSAPVEEPAAPEAPEAPVLPVTPPTDPAETPTPAEAPVTDEIPAPVETPEPAEIPAPADAPAPSDAPEPAPTPAPAGSTETSDETPAE